MTKRLTKWWKRVTMTPAEKYLADATDHCDLERRMKNLQNGNVPYIIGIGKGTWTQY